MRPHLLARSLRAIALACALSLVVVATASARFGSSLDHNCDATIYSQCVASGPYQTVSINIAGSYATQVRWVMANYTSVAPPIEMVECYPFPPNYSDALVGGTTSPVQALAWTQCAGGATYGGSDASHTRWCIPQNVYYNLTYASSYFPTDNAKRYLACHELGHTIGLRHPAASEPQSTCMKSATISPKYVPTYTTTSTVERSQLAAYY